MGRINDDYNDSSLFSNLDQRPLFKLSSELSDTFEKLRKSALKLFKLGVYRSDSLVHRHKEYLHREWKSGEIVPADALYVALKVYSPTELQRPSFNEYRGFSESNVYKKIWNECVDILKRGGGRDKLASKCEHWNKRLNVVGSIYAEVQCCRKLLTHLVNIPIPDSVYREATRQIKHIRKFREDFRLAEKVLENRCRAAAEVMSEFDLYGTVEKKKMQGTPSETKFGPGRNPKGFAHVERLYTVIKKLRQDEIKSASYAWLGTKLENKYSLEEMGVKQGSNAVKTAMRWMEKFLRIDINDGSHLIEVMLQHRETLSDLPD